MIVATELLTVSTDVLTVSTEVLTVFTQSLTIFNNFFTVTYYSVFDTNYSIIELLLTKIVAIEALHQRTLNPSINTKDEYKSRTLTIKF